MRDGARAGCHTTDAARRGGRLVTSACPVATKATPMADILIFHHALGLTPGVQAFADTLRQAGHTVHAPDLYEGRRFDTLDAGVAHAKAVGFDTLVERGVRAADGLPPGLVPVGFSLGVLPAQKLAQTRPGARGALLLYACVPVASFSPTWPPAVPVQVHAAEADPYFVGDGDIDAARALLAQAPRAELFLYPGKQHLFAEVGPPWPQAGAAALLMRRVLAFLAAV